MCVCVHAYVYVRDEDSVCVCVCVCVCLNQETVQACPSLTNADDQETGPPSWGP